MPVLRFFSSTAQPTTLSGSISSGTTSITVGATTGFPAATPYTLALDYGSSTEELVDVTGVAGTNLTVTRGVDGTSAQSHSLGAVVRHVASGRDFADYQTHQAATTAVHGVAGSVVGTSDTQTLGNKTLTSPTINGAAFSGTLSGSPTASGTWGFTGAPNFRGPTATDPALTVRASGDANSRLVVRSDGQMLWGTGSGAGDTVLYRDAADVLATDDTLRVYRSTTAGDALQARVTGDTVSRLNIDADGTMSWGPGGAAALDANFYRVSSGLLKTDTALSVGTALTVGTSATVAGDLSVAGIGQVIVAYKNTTESLTSSTTLQDDDELFLPCVAGAKYLLTGYIKYAQNAAASATSGMKVGFTYSAVCSLEWTSHGTASLTDTVSYETVTTVGTATRSVASNGTVTMALAPVGSLIITTAGTLTLRWAQVVSSITSLNVMSGSWIQLRRIA